MTALPLKNPTPAQLESYRRAAKRQKPDRHAVAGDWTFGPGGKYFKPTADPALALDGYRTNQILQNIDGRSALAEASGEEWQRDGLWKLLGYSRDLYRNNSILGPMVETAINYIVGRGFIHQAKSSDKEWNDRAEAYWKERSENLEHTGTRSWRDVQRMVAREFINTGEAIALKLQSQKIQLIEAEQMRGSTYRDHGVVTDGTGRVTAYQFREWGPQGNLLQSPRQIPAEYVIRVCTEERPSSKRGLPLMQRVFPMLHRIDAVMDSEAISWQMLSKFAVAVLSQTSAFDPSNPTANVPDPTWDPTEAVYESEIGVAFVGRPGDTVQGIDRNIPGKDFPQSARMFLRLLGLPLGLPLECVLLDWSQAGSYSVSRALTEQASMNFSNFQDYIERFNRSSRNWAIEQGIRSGELAGAPDDWRVHHWIRNRFPWIDVLKEIQARREKIAVGLLSWGEACAELGYDADQQVEDLVQDTLRAVKAQQRVMKLTGGVDVGYQRFCGVVVGKTEAAVTANTPTDSNLPEQDPTDTDESTPPDNKNTDDNEDGDGGDEE